MIPSFSFLYKKYYPFNLHIYDIKIFFRIILRIYLHVGLLRSDKFSPLLLKMEIK
jgi:hypothetical protein